MATRKAAANNTDAEVVPGLPEAPNDGNYYVVARSEEDSANDPEPRAQWSLILRVPGEEDYVGNLYTLDDGNITGTAYSLLGTRRGVLRENRVAEGNEVLVTGDTNR